MVNIKSGKGSGFRHQNTVIDQSVIDTSAQALREDTRMGNYTVMISPTPDLIVRPEAEAQVQDLMQRLVLE